MKEKEIFEQFLNMSGVPKEDVIDFVQNSMQGFIFQIQLSFN